MTEPVRDPALEEVPGVAEVALNVPLRRVFDYRVPEALAGLLEPGSRVIVPFGVRVRSGIVVGLKARSALAPERLKEVQRVTGAAPLFPPELLPFTRWVADYYLCGWGEVLEAALPSGLGVKFRAEYRARPEARSEKGLRGLSPGCRALVASGEPWDDAAWSRAAKDPAEGVADRRWLARQTRSGGLVEVRHEFAGTKARHLMERWVRLLPGVRVPPLRQRAGKETRAERVLALLRAEGDVPLANLATAAKDPAAVVRELTAKGWVEVYERRGEERPGPGAAARPAEYLNLNAEQRVAFEALRRAQGQGGYHGFLLEGVTGSGKTEVYLHAVRETLAAGRGALVLVPEIALTESMVDRFRSRFGGEVAVLHSGMGEGERFEAWVRLREGRAHIAIGARSAVFAPVPNLGLVIVDEEHDGSYKQDESPRYHGRDAALLRAAQQGAVAVLGSATPSMESLRNVRLGKLTRLRLERRVEERPLPEVRLVDLRTTPRVKGSALFSVALHRAVLDTLNAGEQAMLFLNRRGFASIVRCTDCGFVLLCANCSITLTYHHGAESLRCHRCDYAQALPTACPDCQGAGLEVAGVGTERIEREAAMLYPGARLLRMDSDTLRRKGELERVMTGIRERRFDLIIGTQVLSKGHDFPHITLVGAILADLSLNLPDFRAPERSFQLLTQMAGRAGRGETPGRVFIQTYNPEHYSLAHVRTHDTGTFGQEELRLREASGSPPFCSQALLWVSDPAEKQAEALAETLGRILREGAVEMARPGAAGTPAGADGGIPPQPPGVQSSGAGSATASNAVRVLGPEPAPIKRLAGRYRFMVLLRAPTVRPLHRLLSWALDHPAVKGGARSRIAVDVDPYDLL